MKNIIISVILLMLVGCIAEPEHSVVSVGRVEKVEVVDLPMGQSQQMMITTDSMILFVLFHHSVSIGAELEIVTGGYSYDGGWVDCVRVVNSDDCWMILK